MIDFTFVVEELGLWAVDFAETHRLALRDTCQLVIDYSIYGEWKWEMSTCEVLTWQTVLKIAIWHIHELIRFEEDLAEFDEYILANVNDDLINFSEWTFFCKTFLVHFKLLVRQLIDRLITEIYTHLLV